MSDFWWSLYPIGKFVEYLNRREERWERGYVVDRSRHGGQGHPSVGVCSTVDGLNHWIYSADYIRLAKEKAT